MRYLIVVPARGGSKGIPMKNIYPLNKKPMILYTLELIAKMAYDGDAVVSTDSEEIAEVARSVDGIQVIYRPKEISTDTASTESVLLHAIDVMKDINKEYDAVITMQVTSPLRTLDTVKECLDEYEKIHGEYDALLTFTETRNDFWISNDKGVLERLYPNAPRRRQDRKPMYVENGLIYITDVLALQNTKSVLGTKPYGKIVSEEESLDINNPIDLVIAECVMKGYNNE